MSRAVRPMPDTTDPRVPAADDTGRFAIDSSARTMLPPANENAPDVLSLEDLGGTLIEAAPRTAPPPPPAASARPPQPASGVFSKRDKPDADPDAALVESLISLRPIYSPTESAEAERAVLEVEDLSLRPDNPYLASSLVPPTEKRSGSRALLWVVTFAALAGIGAWMLAAQQTAPQAASTSSAHLASKPSSGSTETSVPAAANGPTETAVAAPVEPEPEAAAPTAPQTVEPPALRVRATPAAREVAPAEQSAAPAPATALTPSADLPLAPSREQVAAGFEGVRAQLEQCAAGQHGVAQIAATIAGTGRISHALIEGPFAGTPEGSCMARAVRAARFPSFSQAALKVAYPVAF